MVSRGRGTTECECGYELGLMNCTGGPMSFMKYAKMIKLDNEAYIREYGREGKDLVVCKAVCPVCGKNYAFWLSWNREKHEFGRFNTSFWATFDDEEPLNEEVEDTEILEEETE